MKKHTFTKKTERSNTYDLELYEIEKPDNEYMILQLNSDIFIYGIGTAEDDIIYTNKEGTVGCFFVPYCECKSQEVLTVRINALVDECYIKLNTLIKDTGFTSASKIKVRVEKYIDAVSNKRFIAIGAYNCDTKSKDIVDLNVNTCLFERKKPDAYTLWNDTLAEYFVDSKECFNCAIEKSEIMDFESRTVPVTDREIKDTLSTYACDALLLNSDISNYFAKHCYKSHSARFYNYAGKKWGNVYNLAKYRASEYDDINRLTKKMIETFRTLTGVFACEAKVLYNCVSHNAYDVSIIVYAKSSIKSDNAEEEAQF